MFSRLIEQISELSCLDFDVASDRIQSYVDSCEDFCDLIRQIGVIPESIEHDSTEEKLFSKASDAVLARAFRELGLRATVLRERGDSADVIAKSCYHGYSLVADAKAFRLSRTAKNQKDFKVSALSGWRKDADYAVLCSPYYQYPKSRSQIYAQAVDHNVCLLSWEHILFLIQQGVSENAELSLAPLWNCSGKYAEECVVAQKKNCFMHVIDDTLTAVAQCNGDDFKLCLFNCRRAYRFRANDEIAYWETEKRKIQSLTREEAILELIAARKIDEKITQINKYMAGIRVHD